MTETFGFFCRIGSKPFLWWILKTWEKARNRNVIEPFCISLVRFGFIRDLVWNFGRKNESLRFYLQFLPSTFATFPVPHFPRATATLPQPGIALPHALQAGKIHTRNFNRFSLPCDFQAGRAWSRAIPYTLKTPHHNVLDVDESGQSKNASKIPLHFRAKLYRGC